jgi:nitrogen regulatory protein PII
MENIMNDDTMQELYNKIFTMNTKLSNEYDAMAVAAIFVAQAMRMYRTMLNDDEFNRMVETISQSANETKPFTMDIFDTDSDTLH